jgi:membrane-associated phospholipid phosphatase
VTPRNRCDGDLLRNPTATFRLAVVFLALVAATTVLTLVNVEVPPLLHRLDRWWRDIVQPPAAWAEYVSDVLYYIGNSWATVPFRIAIGIWLWRRRRWIDLAAWLGAWAIADLLSGVLKVGVEQPRPDGSDNYAFPSGHAKSAAQISVGLVLLTIPPWRPRWPGWVACTLWIAAMAWSRTILDKHWASNVITGALLGTGAMLLAAAAAQRYRDHRSSNEG